MLFVNDHGQTATLCHCPMMSWPGMSKGGYMVYGHIHNNTDADYWPLIASRDLMLNAGVDINGFAPVTLSEMIENNRRFKENAHGQV
jgi:calcineurin-like phosphoesterase family protein